MDPSGGHVSNIHHVWARLEEEEKELKLERAKARDVWNMILEVHTKNENDRQSIDDAGLFDFVPPETRICLNVGGQLFETTCAVLTRDKYSILAALCREEDPFGRNGGSRRSSSASDKERNGLTTGRSYESSSSSSSRSSTGPLLHPYNDNGEIFIDRDWWIFRHILQFLREGVLPNEVPLLQELYIEACFYKLSPLKNAVKSKLLSKAKPSFDPSRKRGQFLDAILEGGKNPEKDEEERYNTYNSYTYHGDHYDSGSSPNHHSLQDPYGFVRGA